MKKTVSIVSSFLIIIIILILIISFVFMIFNQYQTNTRIQETLDIISLAYRTEIIAPHENTDKLDTTGETTPTSIANTEPSTDNSTASPISLLEYSSAIAYLTKVQEVSSDNNSSTILALIYTIISSLILTYGAKMLRLGENDKAILIQEISQKSRDDISSVEKHIIVKSSMLNAVTAINSATSALQLLLITFSTGDQDDLEEINTSCMSTLSAMDDHLTKVLHTIDQCSIQNIDLYDLDSALSLFEHHYEIYKKADLPKYIDDKSAAQKKVDKAINTFELISQRQSSINDTAKKKLFHFLRK